MFAEFWSIKEAHATSCTLDYSKLSSSLKRTCHHMLALIFKDSMELQQSLGDMFVSVFNLQDCFCFRVLASFAKISLWM
jgi:hypothetical protein